MNTHPQPEKLSNLDSLSAQERSTVLRHVRSCRACRAKLVEERPEALFGLLVERQLPREALERLSRNVATAIQELDPVTARPVPRRWLLAAALAASLLLALVVGLPPLLREGTGRQIADAAPAQPSHSVEPPASGAGEALRLALPVRGIELLSSPGDAEVVDFAIGDAQVVMIFDKELDI